MVEFKPIRIYDSLSNTNQLAGLVRLKLTSRLFAHSHDDNGVAG